MENKCFPSCDLGYKVVLTKVNAQFPMTPNPLFIIHNRE